MVLKIIVILATTVAFCKDFGTFGQTFPIKEEDLLDYLQKQKTQKSLSSIKDRLLAMAQNPAPVKGVFEATEYHRFFIDPTFTAQQDIKDAQGRIVIKKGTSVNPLQKISLSKGLLFFDGSKSSHVKWAREQKGDFKWVLVAGKPIDLESQEGQPVYFDQQGHYLSRFNINHIPAKITQKGLVLEVEEIVLKKSES